MERIIQKIEIDGLFGRFNYKIDLKNNPKDISILTAPNGYGKTTILKIINAFASGDFYYFLRENFISIRFFLGDMKPVEIIRSVYTDQPPQVQIKHGRQIANIRDPFSIQGDYSKNYIVESALPFLSRISINSWRHDRTGEILDHTKILAMIPSTNIGHHRN